MTLEETLCRIRPADPISREAAKRHWDSLAKPLHSLGLLEENLTRIAALTGTEEIRLDWRCLLVLCADNGVVAQGVSQSDASVTAAVVRALGRGCSTADYMARAAACEVLPVDIGMLTDTPPGVLSRKVCRGTADITRGPAMSRAACEQAILTGIRLAKEQAAAGTELLLLGEMGIGNTTTSSAIASVLLGRPPEDLTGRGAGLSDSGLQRKTVAVRKALALNSPDPDDPVDILQKVGGTDLAGLCGICLGAARCRIPVLLDGMITGTAALCAVRLCPAAGDALIASHVSSEPAAELLLQALELQPCIRADLHLGEGSGALLCLSLLDQALAVYRSGHSFAALGIEAYTPQC